MIFKFEVPFNNSIEKLQMQFEHLKVSHSLEELPPRIYPYKEHENYYEIEIVPGQTLVCLDYDELKKIPTELLNDLDTARVFPHKTLDTKYDPFIDTKFPIVKKKKKKKTDYKFAWAFVFFNALGILLYLL